MRRGVEQRLVLVLPVQFDQARREVLQRAGGDEDPVDERAAAALSRDLATDQQLLAAVLENRFDGGGLFARPDKVAGRAAAEQQPDGLDEDRFARRRSHR